MEFADTTESKSLDPFFYGEYDRWTVFAVWIYSTYRRWMFSHDWQHCCCNNMLWRSVGEKCACKCWWQLKLTPTIMKHFEYTRNSVFNSSHKVWFLPPEIASHCQNTSYELEDAHFSEHIHFLSYNLTNDFRKKTIPQTPFEWSGCRLRFNSEVLETRRHPRILDSTF